MGSFTRGLISVVIATLVMCCSVYVEPTVPPAPPGSDDDEVSFCPSACERWVGLGCGDAQVCTRYEEPSDACAESVPCSTWCERIVVEASEGVLFHPRCVAMTEPPAELTDKCSWLDEVCAGGAP